jgi:hypothetical protein
LIEPILIVFLGVVVGGMVICMFLPIFKMSEIVSGRNSRAPEFTNRRFVHKSAVLLCGRDRNQLRLRTTLSRCAQSGFVREIQVVVQAATLGAQQRAAHDQFRHRGDVAQFEQVGRDGEVPVVLVDFLLQSSPAGLGRAAIVCSSARC